VVDRELSAVVFEYYEDLRYAKIVGKRSRLASNEKVSGEIGLTPKGHGDAGDWKDSRSSWDVDSR
jgi:hypothetical protein